MNYAGCFGKNAVSEQFSAIVEKVFSLRAPKARLDHDLAVERSGTPRKANVKNLFERCRRAGRKRFRRAFSA